MTTPAVVMPIGPDRYAVVASSVREVVANARPTPLPTAPKVFVGAFNLRGEVVPTFDTAALLGIGSVQDSTVVVVVNTPAGPAGLLVTGMPKVATLAEAIGPSELRGTSGVYEIENGVAVLLDVEALLLPHTNLAAATTNELLVGR